MKKKNPQKKQDANFTLPVFLLQAGQASGDNKQGHIHMFA